jgi:hypothetical protein
LLDEVLSATQRATGNASGHLDALVFQLAQASIATASTVAPTCNSWDIQPGGAAILFLCGSTTGLDRADHLRVCGDVYKHWGNSSLATVFSVSQALRSGKCVTYLVPASGRSPPLSHTLDLDVPNACLTPSMFFPFMLSILPTHVRYTISNYKVFRVMIADCSCDGENLGPAFGCPTDNGEDGLFTVDDVVLLIVLHICPARRQVRGSLSKCLRLVSVHYQ